MKANTTENLLIDQAFKISPSNKEIRDYMLDTKNDFNIKEQQLKHLNNGTEH